MWLTKLLNTIASRFPNKHFSPEILSELNPDKIYVENVRSLLEVSEPVALQILEEGLKQGLLRLGVEVRCPDGSVAATADNEADLPQTVICNSKDEGHYTEIEMETSSLTTVKFYRLNDKQAASVAIG